MSDYDYDIVLKERDYVLAELKIKKCQEITIVSKFKNDKVFIDKKIEFSKISKIIKYNGLSNDNISYLISIGSKESMSVEFEDIQIAIKHYDASNKHYRYLYIDYSIFINNYQVNDLEKLLNQIKKELFDCLSEHSNFIEKGGIENGK